MANRDRDHRILGELCLQFARKLGGLIDFGGALTPPIRGEVEQLFRDHYLGDGTNWSQWEPYFKRMVQDIPGNIYSIPYKAGRGFQWVSHIGDAEFLEGWLQHPHFHLVK